MPNQRDVAKKAGLSSASVSRYLANPGSVKPKTAIQVEKAIEETGYKVDLAARNLRMGRSFHIGILIPGIGPFYWEVLQGIQAVLSDTGYFCTILYTRDIGSSIHSSWKNLLNLLNSKLIEGVIYFPLDTPEDNVTMENLRRRHQNLVVVDRDMGEPSLDQVIIDNYQAGRKAAGMLLEQGHRNILYFHGLATSWAAAKRMNGFQDCLAGAGIKLGPEHIIHGDYTSATAFKLTRERLSSLPEFTAVFAVNDASAIGFLRAARDGGLECPKDFSLIGFDNNEEFTPYITPSLTTFKQPLNQMGQIAAERLIEQINGTLLPTTTTLQTKFIRRESLGVCRTLDT